MKQKRRKEEKKNSKESKNTFRAALSRDTKLPAAVCHEQNDDVFAERWRRSERRIRVWFGWVALSEYMPATHDEPTEVQLAISPTHDSQHTFCVSNFICRCFRNKRYMVSICATHFRPHSVSRENRIGMPIESERHINYGPTTMIETANNEQKHTAYDSNLDSSVWTEQWAWYRIGLFELKTLHRIE